MQSQNTPLGLTWDLIKHPKAFEIPGRQSFLILKEYTKMHRRNEFISFHIPRDQHHSKVPQYARHSPAVYGRHRTLFN